MSRSATLAGTETHPGRTLNVSLWTAQVLLAGVFSLAGFMKIATPIAVLAQKMAWVNGVPWLVRLIGICEIAGAVGLILPAAFKVLPKLTALAATGLLSIMVLAVPFPHLSGRSQGHRPASFTRRDGCFCRLGTFAGSTDSSARLKRQWT